MSTTAVQPSAPRWRSFARKLGYVTAFNVACAVAITLVAGKVEYFFGNLVGSMCVGTIAFLLIDTGRIALWGDTARAPRLYFVMLVLVAAPIAHISGTTLTGILLGTDLSSISLPSSPRAATTFMFTALATVLVSAFFMSRDRLIRAESAAALEKARAESVARQAVQAQLQMLQAQIEPHMLFNTLANVQGLIGFDPARAQQMLDQLIQYLRATLSASRASSTTLGQEFALLDAYLGLMTVRMGERLRYSLDLPDSLRSAALPPMMLQPLVENAISHGLEPKIDGGQVNVVARREGDTLVLTVSDTGLGLNAPGAKPGTLLGLANTRERLSALFGEHAAITLQDGAAGGAIARLTLPISPT